MTRRGAKEMPWTVAEVERLRRMAGVVPRRDICRELRRSRMSVQKKAAREGLSLRVRPQRLSWCVECASWRTRLDRDGRCRVCSLRSRAEAEASLCAAEYAAMDPSRRAAFDAADSWREPSRPPASPPRGRDEQEDAALAEEFEAARLQRELNAWKSRLRRLRAANGTNPRKK